MPDQTRDDLTAPEQAAMDAWMRGSADTTGMLYAVRHALAHMERSEDARLAIAEKHLRDANEMLCATVENGPWVLIPDTGLRQLVGEYIADTCHTIAAAAGLDEAMERAHDATPQRLAQSLPGRRVVPDARERLARYLFLSERTDEWAPREWNLPQHVNQEPYLRRADALLAVITGKDSR